VAGSGSIGSGDGLPAFGRWLVRERELRGLRREEVARVTKLAVAVVEALESGDEGRIPPRAYVVGYLRAYAAAVGLDADELVLRFHEAAGPVVEGGAVRRDGGSRRFAIGMLIALGLAAASVWALLR